MAKNNKERMMKKIPVTISGLPGSMATMVLGAMKLDLQLSEKFNIASFSLTGSEVANDVYNGCGLEIDLVRPEERQKRLYLLSLISGLIAVDYTHPTAANDNANFYCEHGIPFVMGTTGGDRPLLKKTVEASNISAVIAPNMSAPIVMLMDMIENAGANFPGVLKDYEIVIVESHQAKKADKSGTAIALGKKFERLGVVFNGEDDIRAIRSLKEQRLLGVPEPAMNGHGWHSYALMSPGGDIMLKFEHNINGRQTYVEGTLKALEFLSQKVAEGSRGECFDMSDVMRG